MELRHLRYFIAVAGEKSFNKAAARLRVTQPALSRQIQDLESELGVELLIRKSTGIELTPAGGALLAGARKLTDDAGALAASMRTFAENRRQCLDIGYMAASLSGPVGDAMQVFEQRHPALQLRIFEMSPAQQIAALRDGHLDIALIGNACEELAHDFDLFHIRRIAVHAVLPALHPLAERRSIELTELKREAFVGLNEGSFPGRNAFIRNACQRAGFKPSFTAEADGLVSLLALVGNGKGVTLMPAEAHSLPHPRAVFVPLSKPAVHVEFSAAVRKGERRNTVRSFLQTCRELARPVEEVAANAKPKQKAPARAMRTRA